MKRSDSDRSTLTEKAIALASNRTPLRTRTHFSNNQEEEELSIEEQEVVEYSYQRQQKRRKRMLPSQSQLTSTPPSSSSQQTFPSALSPFKNNDTNSSHSLASSNTNNNKCNNEDIYNDDNNVSQVSPCKSKQINSIENDFNNLLSKEFTKRSDWDTISELLSRHSPFQDQSLTQQIRRHYYNHGNNENQNDDSKSSHKRNYLYITQYHLYLILKQKQIPAPPQIIKTILKAYPELCNHSKKIYHLNVIVAFENPSSLPETLFELLRLSNDPIKLTYMIMQHMIHRTSNVNLETHNDILHDDNGYNNIIYDDNNADDNNGFNSIPEENLQVLIHETFLEALYCHDGVGNILLHQACTTCNSPRMVRLIIEGMMNDIGWWCIIGCNNEGFSPFHLALSCISFQDANAVMDELLRAIPALDLPAKECIVRNDILYVSIRTGNMYLTLKILEAYPSLIDLWSSQGTLPIHDVFQYGTTEHMSRFIELFYTFLRRQINIPTLAWTRFVPIQIACMNPSTAVFVVLRLLEMHYNESSYEQTVRQYGLLHLAAAASNVNIARYLFYTVPEALAHRRFEHFGTWGTQGPIPLFFACVSGSSEMIEFLFKAGRKYHIQMDQHSGLVDSYSGNNLHPIVAACSNTNITTSTMEMLLVQSGLSSQWICDWRLLHCAAFEGNMEVVVALINHFPEALYCLDEDGNLPLHDACAGGNPNMIGYLFVEQTKLSRVGGFMMVQENLCGILDKNHLGETPWDLICEMLECVFADLEDDSHAHFSGLLSAALLTLTLDAAREYCSKDGDSTCNNQQRRSTLVAVPLSLLSRYDSSRQMTVLPVHHSAIKKIQSVTVLENIIVQNYHNCHPLQVDEHGKTALHLAVETQKEDEDWSCIIHHLLYDDENGSRSCACIQDENARYVLHTAAENGLAWNKGLNCIVNSNKAILERRDKITGLIPFMLAASGERSDLNSVFELLRGNPGPLSFVNHTIDSNL